MNSFVAILDHALADIGLQMGITVSSTNPKQSLSIAPLPDTASGYSCSCAGPSMLLFYWVILCPWLWYIHSKTVLPIMHN